MPDAFVTNGSLDAAAPLIIASLVVPLLVGLAAYIWTSLALAAVFRKAGEPAWAGWVPVYQFMVLARIAGYSPALGLLCLVGLGPIVALVASLRLNPAFRAPSWYAVLALLVMPVWASILGFGKAVWHGVAAPAPAPSAPAAEASLTEMFDFGQTVPGFTRAGQPGGAQPPQPPFGAATPLVAPSSEAPQQAYGGPGEAGWNPSVQAWAPEASHPQPHAPATWTPPEAAVPAPSVADAPQYAAPPAGLPPVPTLPASVAAAAPTPEAAAQQWARTPAAEQEAIVARAGATRMVEDSEAVAAARAALARTPQPQPPQAFDDEPATPIVVPGPAYLRGGDPADQSDAFPPVAQGRRSAAPATAPVVPPAVPAPGQVAAPGPWTPRFRNETGPLDSSLELSDEVSAVAGAPDAGAPRSARSSVAAQPVARTNDDEGFEETEIAVRNRGTWQLTPPLGQPIAITSGTVILGRRPTVRAADGAAQVIAVADGTRTISKTHARLELTDGVWTITDLGSTNGVVLIAADGTEQELAAGVTMALTQRFLLGDAELRIDEVRPA